MGSSHVTPDEKAQFVKLIQEGWTVKDAAERVGRSYNWAKGFMVELKREKPDAVRVTQLPTITGPKPYSELTPIAKDCLRDFGRFRARYFGRLSSPWQEDAANQFVTLLESPYKEYVVVNCPPGSGKSTLFTHDIPVWLTCRSRSIRGFIGSSTQKLANYYLRRSRGALERLQPMQASTEDLSRGLARDADTTVTHDYGLFKPSNRLVPWSQFQYTVEQLGETPVGEKETTWSAWGWDSEYLGYRVNAIVWDDLVTPDTMNTLEKREDMQKKWHDEAETRLEPAGLLVLQGQRLRSDDHYRYCLDLKTGLEDLDEHLSDLGEEELPREKKYHHIVYKAHYEEKCSGEANNPDHSINARPYNKDGSGGCLLDPARLSWRELKGVMARPFSNFRVVYQQEDVDPAEVLVPKLWITGGVGDDGIEYQGCLDSDRALAQIPPNLPHGQRLSVVTIDPSPTKYWAIQWWLYVQPDFVEEPGMGMRYLLDLERKPMDAPDLLDFNMSSRRWTGMLEDWHRRSILLGYPYTHLIMENNAAQRFLYQYDFFRQWLTSKGVNLVPHATSRNKADPEYGVKVLKPHYRFGRVRLPNYTSEARHQVNYLVKELTTWPDGSYDDNVMAHWFLEYQLQFLVETLDEPEPIYDDIPSWIRGESA
jgi:hypothetical protein